MPEIDQQQEHRSAHRTGFVAIVGRPNVGKSTLVNHLVGSKISITSRKAQTTRYRIHGIHSEPAAQFVFVDTPGFQLQHINTLNRALNRAVTDALNSVDVVLFVVEAGQFGPRDAQVIKLLPDNRPVILVINKIDRLADKNELLPFIEQLSKAFTFAAIVPVSASTGSNLTELLAVIRPLLPEASPMFDEDAITDRSERFLAAEFIREKLFRLLGEELPYAISVVIDKFEQDGKLRRIDATIIVDKPSQKAMIIGKNGEKLKAIGTQARQEMERLFDGKVFLTLWVKVKGGWAEDHATLRRLGHE